VSTCPTSTAPKPLADQTPGPVPRHRTSDLSAHGEAEPVVPARILYAHEDEERPRKTNPLLEDPTKLGARPEPHPGGKGRFAAHRGSGSDALATLLPAPLQHEAAALGAHPHQESMGPLPTPIVGLERPLHDRLASSPQSRSARQACSRGTKL
jgi:hypothetical protein